MTFQRTFEVHVIRGSGSIVEVDLKEPHGDHPAVLTIPRVEQHLLHALVLSSPDGLVLTDSPVPEEDVLWSVQVHGSRHNEERNTWVVYLDDPIRGELHVDRAAYERLHVGTQLTLRSHPPTPAHTAPIAGGWRFELELVDAIQVAFQQMCELGVIVGAGGGRLERRDCSMVFTGSGSPPQELHDWCRNNDITCAVTTVA